jgi:hypothetical protein
MASKLKYILIALALSVSVGVHAQTDYTPLAPIPQLTGSDNKVNINEFIPNMVKLVISVAAALAVIMIVIGGIKYMSTDAWGAKKDARSTIENAVIGLLLAIGAYSILYTVNPKLVDINFTIQGLRVGGSLATTTGVVTTRGATETGCSNCDELDATRITIRQGACSNNPCYLKEDLIENIEDDLIPALQSSASSTWRALQVVRAFPPGTPAPDGCYSPGPNAGNCIDISMTVLSIDNVKGLLDAIKSKIDDEYTYRYNSCGSRKTELQNHSRLNSHEDSRFDCFSPNRGEFVQIYKPTQ